VVGTVGVEVSRWTLLLLSAYDYVEQFGEPGFDISSRFFEHRASDVDVFFPSVADKTWEGITEITGQIRQRFLEWNLNQYVDLFPESVPLG